MKTLALYFLLLLCIVHVSQAQNVFLSRNTEISFLSEARFENISAVSKKGVSAVDVSKREIAFKVPIQSFKFRNGLMQEHFNETYLESDKYPYATFKGVLMEGSDLSKNGTYNVIVTGQFNLHGVTTERTIPGVVVVQNNKLEITSAFVVPVQDHHIKIPNDKISNISQDIKVKVRAVYEQKN
ncbi:MAG: YceI family protein [Pontibacter sp.]|nr:YceI family protein [Pontibacter sp.]